ncbi:LysR substrate-binding domain-containing protein [Labrys miyagiensis]|nr:LysR substrate-binding domain-containing protein [Labrys miyagiensis]
MPMLHPLPPLAAIRVFEAVARHLSFTKAAEEIGMTQAAVSYQIRVLEERFGGPLFLRLPRQIELTDAGRRLAPAVTEAFAMISEAYAAAKGGVQGTLTISASVTFATMWLARHIGDFQIAHPTIAVRMDASNRYADFSREEADVGIRSGMGQWPGLSAHLLVQGDFAPMLSPRLAASIPVREPSDLLRLPILDADDPWWENWFAAAGTVYPTPVRDRRLGMQAFAASAALAGQGVAILSRALYAMELAEGRLVQPFDLLVQSDMAFYLVYPEARRNVPKIRMFREWILREVGVNLGE